MCATLGRLQHCLSQTSRRRTQCGLCVHECAATTPSTLHIQWGLPLACWRLPVAPGVLLSLPVSLCLPSRWVYTASSLALQPTSNTVKLPQKVGGEAVRTTVVTAVCHSRQPLTTAASALEAAAQLIAVETRHLLLLLPSMSPAQHCPQPLDPPLQGGGDRPLSLTACQLSPLLLDGQAGCRELVHDASVSRHNMFK